MIDNKYPYDNVVNILGITNAAKPASGDIGGASSHVYEYDAINRLISAQGSAKNESYELQMRYDEMSNPLQKDTISYEYETYNHPNAVSRAGSKIFKYDANGNPISVEDTTTNALRVMQWDEENRLQSLGDDGYVSRYTYNHTGERVVKSHGGTTVAYVNGAPQGVIWDDRDNWTAYVSPYMVVNGDRFTKHYYVGSQRIASKIGVGEFNNLYDASNSCVTAGQKDYAERVSLITQSRDDYNAALGIAPGPPMAKGIYGEAEYSGAYGSYAIKPLGNYDVPTGWPSKPYKRPYGGTPGAPVMYQKPSDPDETGAGYGYSNAEGLSENDVYFYHSDHLGSTSYITDRNGNVSQYIAYKPFGETLVDEHAVSYDSPWKFNGKEWDSETGLYYYGARYYEPEVGLWYGVDALAEKYPAVGGYVYCAANPVRFVDTDGNSPFSALIKYAAKKGIKDGIYAFVKQNIQRRLNKYMTEGMTKQFLKDVDDVVSMLDNSWWETALELIPVAGDIYGSTKFVKRLKEVYDKLQDLENKYVGKIAEELSGAQKKKFIENMRRRGVEDARKDQAEGLNIGGTLKYEKNSGIDGHHIESVSEHYEEMTDPRNILFMHKEDHIEYHKIVRYE